MNTHFEVAMTRCYFCGEPFEIIINSKLDYLSALKVKNLHNHVISMDPCNKCQEWMQKGIILLVIDEDKCEPGWSKPGDGEMPNPYRTGQVTVMTEDAVRRMFGSHPAGEFALKHRWMFIDKKAADEIGLPKETHECAE